MQDKTKKERGTRIRSLRKMAGLTLEALAKEIGVRYQSICEWEKGDTSPSVDNIGRLSITFNVHPTWLWTGQGPKDIDAPERTGSKIMEAQGDYLTGACSATELHYSKKLIDVFRGKEDHAISSLKTSIDIFHQYCHKK